MKTLFLHCLLLFHYLSFCQNGKNHSVEASLKIKRDKQASYVTRYETVSYQNDLQLLGTSLGLDFSYKKLLKKSWFLGPSMGYYMFSVDKIVNYRIPARQTDPIDFRPIDYSPDSIQIQYGTKKYHYNTASLGFSLGKKFLFKEKHHIVTALNFTYLLSYSQSYKIGNSNIRYKTDVNKTFGYIIDSRIGLIREYKKLYLVPSIVIPVYKQWKKDAVFLEHSNEEVHNWFGGYGLSITVGKYLK